MAFNSQTFLMRLDSGKSWSLLYTKDEVEGMIEVWKNNAKFILTWEECPKGQQYDESTYTKDERMEFSSSAGLLAYLEQYGIELKAFKP